MVGSVLVMGSEQALAEYGFRQDHQHGDPTSAHL